MTDTPDAPNWIIMPFIDCWDYTRPAASDALAQKIDPQPSLLLIDNGSSYKGRLASEEFCKLKHPNLLLWRHAPPLPSLAATWNRALDFVWEAGGESALVVNNDVRLNRHTYAVLHWAQAHTDALFITGVGVKESEFDPSTDHWKTPGIPDDHGGPDFSCFLISHACHEKYRFDENFVPAYHEDGDYCRRMWLVGDGHRIFSVNLPFLHYGSRTINRDEKTAREWAPKFERCREYYVKKWGGVPHEERYLIPFDETSASADVGTPGGVPGDAPHKATTDSGVDG